MKRKNMITKIEKIPISEESYPFTSAKKYGYLAAAEYEEEEYFMHGSANVYQTEADGRMGIRFPNAPYVNRFIVRRPSDPMRFSGNVVVEIINPTSFMDLERMWVLSSRQLMRNGDIYVGITSKPITIEAALKPFNPERYGRLSWANPTMEQPFPFTQDDFKDLENVIPDQNINYEIGLFWDMLTDLGDLLRSDDEKNPLRELRPRTIVLTGWSQSGCYLVRYLNDFAYLTDDQSVFDGFLAAGPPRYFATPVNQYETLTCAKNIKVQIKQAKEPCIVLQTESENSLLGAAAIVRDDQEDEDFLCRHFDIAGASHDTVYTLLDYYKPDQDLERIGFRFRFGGKNDEPNHYPTELLVGAMFRNLFYWIHEGVAPQPCERIRINSKGENVRDAMGNSIGGIRTCLLDYPTGAFYQYGDINVGESGLFPKSDKDILFGHEESFPAEMLQHMYGSLEHYHELVADHTRRLIMKGYLVKEDADLMIEEAMTRAAARGLK